MNAFTTALAFEAGVIALSVVSLTLTVCLWRLWRKVDDIGATVGHTLDVHAAAILDNHERINSTRRHVGKVMRKVQRLRDERGRFVKVKKAA